MECFYLRIHSMDGCEIAVGGLCDGGRGGDAGKRYKKSGDFLFGQSLDGYQIDKNLYDRLSALTPPYVRALGASIHVPGVTIPCGGIVGDPFDVPAAAPGKMVKLKNGAVVAAFPGGPGLLMFCGEEEFLPMFQILYDEKRTSDEKISFLLPILSGKKYPYLLVADGSGPGARVFLSAGDERKILP